MADWWCHGESVIWGMVAFPGGADWWYSCHICSRSTLDLVRDRRVHEAQGWNLVNCRDKWGCCFEGGLLLVLRMKRPSLGSWDSFCFLFATQERLLVAIGHNLFQLQKNEINDETDKFCKCNSNTQIWGREKDGPGDTFPSMVPAPSGLRFNSASVSPCFYSIFAFWSPHSSSQ